MITSTEDLIQEALKKAISYTEYRELVTNLTKNDKSTGPTQTDELANFTKLNDRRMKRWDKTFKIDQAVTDTIEEVAKNHTWLVLTESWCGDAAIALPVMKKVTDLNPSVSLKLVMRDENEALMNRFLTNGGKSIPKLVAIDNDSQKVIGTWGPRSQNATKLVEDHKALHGTILPEFKEELQVWYNTDKGQSILKELLVLFTLE